MEAVGGPGIAFDDVKTLGILDVVKAELASEVQRVGEVANEMGSLG